MQLIHTQAGDNGSQKRFERGNGFGRRGRITQVGFLHHVLSIHRTTKHAVGDGKEVRPVAFKGFHHVPPPSSLCPAWLHLLFLCPGLLSTLCPPIAPLPYPHEDSRPLCRDCQVAHKPPPNDVSQP